MLRWRSKLLSCHSLWFSFTPPVSLDAGLGKHATLWSKIRRNPHPCMHISNMRVAAARVKMPSYRRKNCREPIMSRKLHLIFSAFTAIVVLAAASYFFTRHAAAVTQNPAKAETAATPASGSTANKPELPPGTISFVPKAATLAVTVARKYLTVSTYMTVPEYETAIRNANGGKASFKKGEEVLVPGIEPQPVVEKTRPVPKDEEIRAVYLMGSTAGSAHGIELIRRWKEAGGNAVVFDIKDSDGTVNVPFQHPLAPIQKNHPLSNLPKFIRYV